MQVVIVESPAKAKTINKYLGTGYKVLASCGHIRDLPPKDGSVDPDDDFAMKMWDAGCRVFIGVGESRVYHFISKSTVRIKKNNGKKQFLKKDVLLEQTLPSYAVSQ